MRKGQRRRHPPVLSGTVCICQSNRGSPIAGQLSTCSFWTAIKLVTRRCRKLDILSEAFSTLVKHVISMPRGLGLCRIQLSRCPCTKAESPGHVYVSACVRVCASACLCFCVSASAVRRSRRNAGRFGRQMFIPLFGDKGPWLFIIAVRPGVSEASVSRSDKVISEESLLRTMTSPHLWFRPPSDKMT